MATATNMITTSCGSFMPEKPENYLSDLCIILTITGEMNGIAAHSSSRRFSASRLSLSGLSAHAFAGKGKRKWREAAGKGQSEAVCRPFFSGDKSTPPR